MRARIHRGAHEVGGSCVELEHSGQRLVLDLGLPLDVASDQRLELPAIAGLDGTGDPPLGVVVSHGHPDHYGLVPQIQSPVPLYIGEAAYRILEQAAFFTGAARLPAPAGFLRDRERLDLGPFRVTPYLADHSAFDSYSLLVEAGARRVLYSGDLRAHGRKPGAFTRLVAEPPRPVHTLLLEGTQVGREGAGSGLSEAQLERALAERFGATAGAVLACYSGQNIDRLVTMFRASKRSGRTLVLDLYTALIARATGRPTIPQADWARVRVLLPQSQRARVIREQAFALTNSVRPERIYPRELASRASELVVTFRASMARDLERADCLDGASVVWSLWPGYLEREGSRGVQAFCDRHCLPLAVLHASGHARVEDLQRFATAIDAERIVPIHTAAPERFADHFQRVQLQSDGAWWDV